MTTDGSYGYDPAAAQAAEDRVETAATSLQGSVDELKTQLQTLSGSWDGDEHEQYSGVHQKVSDGFESITQTLSQIKAALGDNTQAVAAMRQGVQQSITGGKA
ncbi:WXG100 family type VII secretion target [Gordonia sp. PDNC005]|uniref:WXG100 family type VII secretion target n=1 Tax=unclassified Gordonia (in: high G+C Gram-positive bacteria) TaxID=2657482 RepID=UPI00196393A9|nr:WXG100 family type VII secretion target [Gordonia sp. PDNC005]QRY63015.1 WXG100 family type VII secretion target [Gordonia sp. PDNC005]